MQVQELMEALETTNPDAAVFVALFALDGTTTILEIEDITPDANVVYVEARET